MKLKFSFFLLVLILGMIRCSAPVPQPQNPETAVLPNENHTINAVLWHQTAAEYKALCYQTYRFAKYQLDEKLQNHAFPYDLPPAIVMDLDETVLDNSFFNAHMILDSLSYEKGLWKEWSDLKKAGAVPGAIEFIRYAQSKGVEVFFISNRRENELHATLVNLDSLGLPGVDTSHVLLRVDEASKKARRDVVSKDYEIMLFFGDNLSDFTELFDHLSHAERGHLVDSLKTEFGDRYIVLPNVIYGDWEGSLFHYQYDYSQAQEDSIRRSWLKGY
jgi:5'-nucleotidase (lipoprotein e(P4) family)